MLPYRVRARESDAKSATSWLSRRSFVLIVGYLWESKGPTVKPVKCVV